MGVRGQKQILYLSKKISLAQLIEILSETVRRRGVNRRPCVVIDANQIGMRFKSPAKVAVVAHVLAAHRIDVIVAADGPSRLQTKLASVERGADRVHARIASMFAKSELAILLQNNSPDGVRKKELNRLIRSKERLASNVLDANFLEALMGHVEYSSSLPLDGNISLMVAKKQADPMIARLLLTGVADAIMSSDSDFAAYTGSECLCIKHFDLSTTENKIDNIELSTGDEDKASEVASCLRDHDNNNLFIIPDFPLFSRESNYMIRALICVGLGCDVYPGGVKGYGPSKMYKDVTQMSKLSLSHEERIKWLAATLARESNKSVKNKTTTSNMMDEQTLLTLARAFVYEPCNDNSTDDGDCLYLYDKPTVLERYLCDYAPSDGTVCIVDGPEITTCHGYGHGVHKFLSAEGVYTCARCSVSLCRFCYGDANGCISCLDCLRGDVAGVGDITASEMRATLRKLNAPVPETTTYHELMCLYESIVDQRRTSCITDVRNTSCAEYFKRSLLLLLKVGNSGPYL